MLPCCTRCPCVPVCVNACHGMCGPAAQVHPFGSGEGATDLCRIAAQGCHDGRVTLSELITKRMAELGALEHPQRKPLTFRDLERRARERGHKISFSSLAAYARGERTALPPPETRAAIAAAIGVPEDVVTQAAIATAAPQVLDDKGRVAEHAMAWLVLTEGRTDEEIQHLLGVAREVLRGLDAVRDRNGK